MCLLLSFDFSKEVNSYRRIDNVNSSLIYLFLSTCWELPMDFEKELCQNLRVICLSGQRRMGAMNCVSGVEIPAIPGKRVMAGDLPGWRNRVRSPFRGSK